MLSKHQETGYSIMRMIEDKTEGAWRPGPGTVYPLLRSLVKEGLLERAGSAETSTTVKYSVTRKGRQELEEMQRTLASAGKRERVMIRLFADLLPAEAWASAFVNRGREIFDVFQEKISQIPQPQRNAMLREARLMLDANMSWVDSQLRPKKKRVVEES
jgi:DNA-binding PadR family transcriptional regulator